MINENAIPKHIAFIMDGNGRWAKERGLPRVSGHRAGVSRIKEIIKASVELEIKVVTFFAFSHENWKRPRKEISVLMRFLNDFLDHEIQELHKRNARFMVIGRDKPLSKYLHDKISDAENLTKNNNGLITVFALNYGARQEIVDAIKRLTDAVIKGDIEVGDLNEEIFSRYLYTAGLPDPDLLIRTSGEMRLSNFLLWQLSYAELYFPNKYWPDFGKEDLENAIKVYQNRERRFGKIYVKKQDN